MYSDSPKKRRLHGSDVKARNRVYGSAVFHPVLPSSCSCKLRDPRNIWSWPFPCGFGGSLESTCCIWALQATPLVSVVCRGLVFHRDDLRGHDAQRNVEGVCGQHGCGRCVRRSGMGGLFGAHVDCDNICRCEKGESNVAAN